MKDLNDVLAKKFLETCDNIKNAQNSDDLNFYEGSACGIASGLLLSGLIDVDCYTLMHLYIDVMRVECYLKEDAR